MNYDPSRAEALFHAAAEIVAPGERVLFLQRECAGDDALRARVKTLLASHDQATRFLDPAASSPELEAEFARLKPEESGERIAHYKLLQQIGEGAFGIVWMAEQEQPVRRRVALKIIKLGMDTKEVIARFEQECQALAMMDHPNIAKVFDAGATPFGRPYFVMELVRGIEITKYCDEVNLPTAERLQLFITVCQAVQHAHQKGIIHRDLKPSNIMVTLHDGVPVPKVIDFGVAKAIQARLTERTLFTQFDQMIGTPLYMSPEQAELSGLDIDTRSDIYSLGVLLYELLTGRTPVDAETLRHAGLDEMRRIIREHEPPRPSIALQTMAVATRSVVAGHRQVEPPRLIGLLRGDLDWIVMKALEKDRSRRYETANGLALDIKRHLANEPVIARPPSAAYRIRKTLRRNKLAFAAGAAVALALLVGISVSTWQAIRATRAEGAQTVLRRKAEANEQQALREKEATRRALATSQIALADAAYREQDGPGMQMALKDVPEDLRDSNWSYLLAKSDTSLVAIRSHSAKGIASVEAHPKRPGVFAIAGMDHGVELMQVRTGARLLAFQPGFKDKANSDYSLAFSPDGERLAIGRRGPGGIVIHSARDGTKLVEWESADTDRLQFSPDGRQLLEAVADRQVIVRDCATGQVLWKQRSGAHLRAAFDPGGQMVLVAFAAKLKLLNAADGTLIRALPDARDDVTGIAIRPDGRRALVAASNGFVLCVDMHDGRVLYEMRASDGRLANIVYTMEGDRFVTMAVLSGRRPSLQVWDAESGVLLQPLLGSTFYRYSGGLGVHSVSGEIVTDGFAAKVWVLAGQREKWEIKGRAGAKSIAFWKTDDWIFAPTGADLELLDLQTTDPVRHPLAKSESPGFFHVSVSADGRVAAVGQSMASKVGEIRMLRLNGRTVETAAAFRLKDQPNQMELSPAGDRLWTGKSVADTTTGATLLSLDLRGIFNSYRSHWLNNAEVIASVAANAPRGQSGSEEKLIVWDANTGQRLRTATTTNRSVIHALDIAPGGKTFAEAGADKMVRLRDARTLAVTKEFRAHDGPIMALAYHPTQPILATASEDLTIKLWNPDTGQLLDELRGPLATPIDLTFSPTGKRLACLSSDRTVRIWEPKSLQ